MFHTMPHKVVPVAIHAVAPVVEPLPDDGGYAAAFLKHSPLMAAKWRKATVEACHYAAFEIHDLLPLHGATSSYTGKLYAELDAIRDRLHALRKVQA